MRNFKIVLQYEGTRYQGWQKQDSTENTIQGKLEALLSKMCEAPVTVQGSGRTDAGVHALGQVANACLQTDKSAADILLYMNKYLPEDIGVLSVEEVGERFHSRLNAKEKTYCYKIINSGIPHVFERRTALVVEEALDMQAMERAAAFLTGTHDFKSFTSAKRGKKSTVRTIDSIRIEKEEDVVLFTFVGDGFLYHMIRILMGTLLEIGTGNRVPEEIPGMIKAQDREKAGPLVPACGLMLMGVRY